MLPCRYSRSIVFQIVLVRLNGTLSCPENVANSASLDSSFAQEHAKHHYSSAAEHWQEEFQEQHSFPKDALNTYSSDSTPLPPRDVKLSGAPPVSPTQPVSATTVPSTVSHAHSKSHPPVPVSPSVVSQSPPSAAFVVVPTPEPLPAAVTDDKSCTRAL